MAHLWVNDASPGWAVLPLEGEAFRLDTNPPRASDGCEADVVLTRIQGDDDVSWCLLCIPSVDVQVNGFPLSEGIRLLDDRDEIRVAGAGTLYFSTERIAAVEPFDVRFEAVFCPRCRLEIEDGSNSVGCPGCGAAHHQTDERECWTYGETCSLCPQPTALDGTYRWVPDDV